MRVKNTYGCSSVLASDILTTENSPKYSGSSLDRKKGSNIKLKQIIKSTENEPISKEKKNKVRVMSTRTKTKIRKKILAFSQLHKKLTFVTLTFVNEVTDEQAVRILGKFINNTKKRSQKFSYLWVAERQNNNKVFSGNIHFHLVTDKYWNIPRTLDYWLELQAKNGIKTREEHFKPSSAFDVKKINTKSTKEVGAYLTKYVTKNIDEFRCQVWNCSKDISALYTDFYTGFEFVEELRRLKFNEIKEVPLEYCTLYLIPLDKITMRFYDRLTEKNKQTLKDLNNLKCQNLVIETEN